MKHWIILTLLSNALVAPAQLGDILSLRDDSVKVKKLLDLGYEYESSNADSALLIYEIAGKIGKSTGYDLGYGRSLNYRGIVEFERGNYTESEAYYLQSIEVFRSVNYQKGIAASYNNIGNIHLQLGDFEKCTDNYLQALAIFEKIHDSISLIRNLNNLGTIFFDNKQYDKGAFYYRESLRLSSQVKGYPEITDIYLNLANTYNKLGDEQQSTDYLYKARSFVDEAIDPYGALIVYVAFSHHLSDSGKQRAALDYARKSLELAYDIGNPYNICESLITTGENYYRLGGVKRAEQYYNKALKIALENKFTKLLERLYFNRAQLMAGMNNFRKAYDDLLALNSVKDTLFRKDKQIVIQELETKYQSVKKETMLAEQELTILEQKHKVSRQRSLIFWILITLSGIVFTLFLGIAFIQQRRKILHNRLLSLEKEKEIQNMKSLIEGEERERSRLAKELHDGVNGSLGAIKLLAGNETGISKKNREKWEKISGMIDQVSNEVREISHNLMPDILIRLGIQAAINSYIQKIAITRAIDIDFQCYGNFEGVENSIQMTIYRIVQELVRNILKHANATECIIQLNRHNENISLTVEDNGSGFDIYDYSKEHKVAGIGLQSIYSRVNLIGGKIDIQSTLKTGTAVYVDIPVKSPVS